MTFFLNQGLPFLSAVLLLIGYWRLVGKHRDGFWLQVAGSTVAIAQFLLTTPLWGYILLNAVFIVISVVGWRKWKQT